MLLAALSQFFHTYPNANYWLAYSGGLDSHALVHACAALRRQNPELNVRAIHIDHGLQAISSTWAAHCQQVCDALQIALTRIELKLSIPKGESLEAVARYARYEAFKHVLGVGDYLLTAHHQDDQAETLLLNLLRGSGVEGLAAMPLKRNLGQAYLLRPLLGISRAELHMYAQQHHLQYIHDPSNDQLQFERNYLRHEIVPKLTARWPSSTTTLGRAAQWQAEQVQLNALLLGQGLPAYAGTKPQTLSIKKLLAEPNVLQKALLRYWLKTLGFKMPNAAKLQQILSSVMLAKPDASPVVDWQGCEIRRYRDDLYALRPLKWDQAQVWVWEDLTQPAVLAEKIALHPKDLGDLKNYLNQKPVYVRFRQGGERILRHQLPSIELKKLLQALAMPAWERERIPLIYYGEQLIAIAGYWHAKPEWLLP
ncbi:tRNA lysidine(34) synthetase TilS [Thiolinea disciformis]|uniref:tRNA lysidine(34) synthetase TilS n=1 Tax=Thiolinea disciformis TaxID=125614 RepID=UPI0003663861|nr:tRNA lysidine(34) synthetase TilS [Thiolinea disciformis]